MYARSVETRIPVEAENFGFDLMLGEWLPPYGNGKVPDFVFRVDRTINAETDFSAALTLSFSNPGTALLRLNLLGTAEVF
jgi:hypothetical protein